jgi:hypothetical protein
MFANVRQCAPMCANVRQCAPMCANVRLRRGRNLPFIAGAVKALDHLHPIGFRLDPSNRLAIIHFELALGLIIY